MPWPTIVGVGLQSLSPDRGPSPVFDAPVGTFETPTGGIRTTTGGSVDVFVPVDMVVVLEVVELFVVLAVGWG